MPGITALLHTSNDALRLGRALETLRPCDEIVIVDHASQDATPRVAREYGARVLAFKPEVDADQFLQLVRHDWVLCLDPREALTEALEATLHEWKLLMPDTIAATKAFDVFLRQETPEGWLELPVSQTRLVPRNWNRWHGLMPAKQPDSTALEGELLRFLLP
jgi:hypothetical protein